MENKSIEKLVVESLIKPKGQTIRQMGHALCICKDILSTDD